MDWIKVRLDWLRSRYAEGDVSARELTVIYNEKFHENRTERSVQAHLKGLHPKIYTKEQKRWLKLNRGKTNYRELAILFNEKFGTCRSEHALRQQVVFIKREIKNKYGKEFEVCTRE